MQQWDAHLLTKQHRTSVAREKASQAKAQQAAAKKRSLAAESSTSASATKKVRIEEPDAGTEAEPAAEASTSALPAGFFSDPAKQAEATAEPEAETEIPLPNATGDAELDDFFASLAAPPTEAAPAAAVSSKRRQKEREEVTAEEVEAQTMYSSAPVRLVTDADKKAEAAEEAGPEETEFDKRARLAQYEKEEVMSRLLEEERAQCVPCCWLSLAYKLTYARREDADQRVAALKARMEAVKARRKALAEAGGLNAKAKAKPKAS